MFFIIADSEPSLSIPCNVASCAAETKSPRQTSVDWFSVHGHGPHLVKRERHIVTAARIIKRIRDLITA